MKLKRNLSLLIIALFISAITYAQNKADAKNLVKQGFTLYEAGKYNEAIQKYQEAIKIDTENSEGLYLLSYALFAHENKRKEVLPYLEKVIKLNPNVAGAYDMLGSIYDDDKQTEKALDYYLRGIKVAPNYQQLHYHIAIAYYNLGRYAEAEASIINAIKLNPRHANSQKVYALAASLQKKRVNALFGWCSFLLLEPQTNRSVEAMAFIKATIYGIKNNTDKNATTSIKDNNMKAASLMSRALVNATDGKTELLPVDSLTLQLTALFQAAPSIISDKDQPFASKFLAGYFEELGKSTNMPAFVRYISMSVFPDENKKWFAVHGKELTALDIWVRITHREF